ncbi:MAG TPA: hypothetical protein VEU06_01400 [Micropepsaceae bacterium]|nr:hypothetical protein [Micropepsaceae bacterium]
MKHLKRMAFGSISAVVLAWPAIAADSIPDLSGEWGRTNFNLEAPPSGPGPVTNRVRRANGTIDDNKGRVGDYMHPLIRPEAAAILKKRGEFSMTGQSIPDPHNQCRPEPPPFTLTIQLEVMLLQNKDEVTLVYVNGEVVRHVKLNVPHPKNLVPSWQGDSVGHYEGDTLVVDTVGIKTGPYAVIDRYGTPFSEQLHVTERYRLIDGKEAAEAIRKHRRTFEANDAPARTDIYGADVDLDPSHKGLQIEVTVDDPGTFTAPWKGLVTYTRGMGWPEMSCAESPQQSAGLVANYPTAPKPDF